MIDTISREQFEELCEVKMFDSQENFHKMLEEITGIVAKPYVSYQYFYDTYYIGDSNYSTVRDLIGNALIKIKD